MLGGSAIAAAATVHTWPAVAATAIVLVLTIISVALGPTVTHTESEVDDHTIAHEHQLVFARRASNRRKRIEHVALVRRAGRAGDERSLQAATPATIRAWALSKGLDVQRTGSDSPHRHRRVERRGCRAERTASHRMIRDQYSK